MDSFTGSFCMEDLAFATSLFQSELACLNQRGREVACDYLSLDSSGLTASIEIASPGEAVPETLVRLTLTDLSQAAVLATVEFEIEVTAQCSEMRLAEPIEDVLLLTTQGGTLDFQYEFTTPWCFKAVVFEQVACYREGSAVSDCSAIFTEPDEPINEIPLVSLIADETIGVYEIDVTFVDLRLGLELYETFTLRVEDGCNQDLPLIDDRSGGVLTYTPFSNLVLFDDVVQIREGLGRCYTRSSNIVTQLICYETDFRRRLDCPFYLNFEDSGTSFSLSADLGEDVVQYDSFQVGLQLVTNTVLGLTEVVRVIFEVPAVCKGADLGGTFLPDQSFTVYDTKETAKWQFNFVYTLPNCNFRHKNEIVVSQTCYRGQARLIEIPCPDYMKVEGTQAYLEGTEDSPLEAGQYFVRARAFVESTQSEAWLDYALKLVDPCTFDNLSSPKTIASLYIYRIGDTQDVQVNAALQNRLCPSDPLQSTYRLECEGLTDPKECPSGFKIDSTSGLVSAGTTQQADVGLYELTAIASNQYFASLGEIEAASFNIEVKDGCDKYGQVLEQNSLGNVVYEIGTEAETIELDALFGLSIATCDQRFSFELSCATCPMEAFFFANEWFRIETGDLSLAGEYIITIQGNSAYGQKGSTTVSVTLRPMCRDLKPSVDQMSNQVKLQLGVDMPSVQVYDVFFNGIDYCTDITIAQAQLTYSSDAIAPYLSVDQSGKGLAFASTSLSYVDLIGTYSVSLAFETSLGHQESVSLQVEIADDTCSAQELTVAGIDGASLIYDLSEPDTSLLSINVITAVSECPFALSLEILCLQRDCEAAGFLTVDKLSATEFKVRLITTELPIEGLYDLQLTVTDSLRGKQSTEYALKFLIFNSCAGQALTLTGVPKEPISFDLSSDQEVSVQLSVQKSLNECPTDLQITLECQDLSVDCSDHSFVAVAKQSENLFSVDITKPISQVDLGYYIFSVAVGDASRGLQSPKQILVVDLKDTCRKNELLLSELPSQSIAYDVRRPEEVTYTLTVTESTPQCSADVEMQVLCDEAECPEASGLTLIKTDSLEWQVIFYTEATDRQGIVSFQFMAYESAYGHQSSSSTLKLDLIDPCADQSLSLLPSKDTALRFAMRQPAVNLAVTILLAKPDCPLTVPALNLICKDSNTDCSQFVQLVPSAEADLQYTMTVETSNQEYLGIHVLELQAYDTASDLQSPTTTFVVQIADECGANQLTLAGVPQSPVPYTLSEGSLAFTLTVTQLLENCPIEIDLAITCDAEVCPDDLIRLVKTGLETFELSVQTSSVSLAKDWLIGVTATDSVYGIRSQEQLFDLSVLNPCAGQGAIFQPLLQESASLQLGQQPYELILEATKIIDNCPLNVDLNVSCEGCPLDRLVTISETVPDTEWLVQIQAVESSEFSLVFEVTDSANEGSSPQEQMLLVSIIDPCVGQAVTLSPSFGVEAKAYILGDPSLNYTLEVATALPECPASPSLLYLCNGEACPDFISVTQIGDSYSLQIYAESEADAGEYLIEVWAEDEDQGLSSQRYELLVIVVDPCAKQIIVLKPFSEELLEYDLQTRQQIQFDVEVVKAYKDCPVDLRLSQTCDDGAECASDNFFSVSPKAGSSDTWTVTIETQDEAFLGDHVVTFQAEDLLKGLTSPPETTFIRVFDSCTEQTIVLASQIPQGPVLYDLNSPQLSYEVSVLSSVSTCPVVIKIEMLCDNEPCPVFINLSNSSEDLYSLQIFTDNLAFAGDYTITLQALDSSLGLQSNIESIDLTVQDPCIKQTISIVPLEPSIIRFAIQNQSQSLEISAKVALPECEVDLSLTVTCDGLDCPDQTFFTINAQGLGSTSWLMELGTEDADFLGTHSIEFQATDVGRGLVSPIETLQVEIFDSCAPQKLSIANLPTDPVSLDIRDMPQILTITVGKELANCPVDPALFVYCQSQEGLCPDDSPLVITQLTVVTYQVSFTPSVVSTYTYFLQTTDTERGYSSDLYELSFQVSDKCAQQRIRVVPLSQSEVQLELRGEPLEVVVEVRKYLADCPAEIDLMLTCDGAACPEGGLFTIIQSVDVPEWTLSLQTDDTGELGVTVVEINAVDVDQGLESITQEILTVEVVDPCESQSISVIGLEDVQLVTYRLKVTALSYSISVENSIQKCPASPSLLYLCNREACPNFISVTQIGDSYSLQIYAESESDAGEYLIEVWAEDGDQGLQATVQSLTVTVVDPCANQVIVIRPLAEQIITYDVQSKEPIVLDYKVIVAYKDCPVDLRLSYTCDDGAECASDNFFSVSPKAGSSDTWTVTIETQDEAFLGDHVVTFQAEDLLKGLTSPLETAFIRVFDSCADQGLELLTDLPSGPVIYNIEATSLTYRIHIIVKLPLCPIEPSLIVTCNGSPCPSEDSFITLQQTDTDLYAITLYTVGKSDVGSYQIQVQAVDGNLGIASQTESLDLTIIDFCAGQELTLSREIDRVYYNVSEQALSKSLEVTKSLDECPTDIIVSLLCAEGSLCPWTAAVSVSKQTESQFQLTVNSRDFNLAGEYQVSLVATDQINGKSSQEVTMLIVLVDECSSGQALAISPPDELITFQILQDEYKTSLPISSSLQLCPLDLELTVLCNDLPCPTVSPFMTVFNQQRDAIELTIDAQQKNQAGIYDMQLHVTDLIRGLASPPVAFRVEVVDRCSDSIAITPLPKGVMYYELLSVENLDVQITNGSPDLCPLDLRLMVECDGRDCDQSPSYLYSTEKSQGLHQLEIFTNEAELIGPHQVQVKAIDRLTGFQSVTETLDLVIIPDCVSLGIQFDETVVRNIRIDEPGLVIEVDLSIQPAQPSQCPDGLISLAVIGQDRNLFTDKVSETGLVTLSDLPSGTYSFAIEVSVLGSKVESIPFSVFVRQFIYESPLPLSITIRPSYTSLILLEDSLDLRVIEDPLGIVTVYQEGSRATRTALMVSLSGSEPEGLHLILLYSQEDYPVVFAVEISDQEQVEGVQYLSAPTVISKDWKSDPLTNAQPISPGQVTVSFKEDIVSDQGEVTIVFEQALGPVDYAMLSEGALQLSTEPAMQFSWTAREDVDGIRLKLTFDQPDLVSQQNLDSDFTRLTVKFLDPNAFIAEQSFASLVSPGYSLTIGMSPIETVMTRKLPEDGSGTTWALVMLVMVFITFNILGFYRLQNHQGLVWKQLEFIQLFTLLALMTKSGDILSLEQTRAMVDLGSLARLDFASFMIPKTLSYEGVDQLALFGYDVDASFFWEGYKGPLNLFISLMSLMPFAILLRIAGCKSMNKYQSMRINFVAEAYMVGSMHNLLAAAQLHLLVLMMLGISNYEATPTFMTGLLLLWHQVVHVWVIYKSESQSDEPRSRIRRRTMLKSLVQDFGDGAVQNLAFIQPVVLCAHNAAFTATLVFAGSDPLSQAYLLVAIEWLYAVYIALAKPFEEDNCVAVMSRVAIIGAVVHGPDPVILGVSCAGFAFVHAWRLVLRGYLLYKEMTGDGIALGKQKKIILIDRSQEAAGPQGSGTPSSIDTNGLTPSSRRGIITKQLTCVVEADEEDEALSTRNRGSVQNKVTPQLLIQTPLVSHNDEWLIGTQMGEMSIDQSQTLNQHEDSGYKLKQSLESKRRFYVPREGDQQDEESNELQIIEQNLSSEDSIDMIKVTPNGTNRQAGASQNEIQESMRNLGRISPTRFSQLGMNEDNIDLRCSAKASSLIVMQDMNDNMMAKPSTKNSGMLQGVRVHNGWLQSYGSNSQINQSQDQFQSQASIAVSALCRDLSQELANGQNNDIHEESKVIPNAQGEVGFVESQFGSMSEISIVDNEAQVIEIRNNRHSIIKKNKRASSLGRVPDSADRSVSNAGGRSKAKGHSSSSQSDLTQNLKEEMDRYLVSEPIQDNSVVYRNMPSVGMLHDCEEEVGDYALALDGGNPADNSRLGLLTRGRNRGGASMTQQTDNSFLNAPRMPRMKISTRNDQINARSEHSHGTQIQPHSPYFEDI